MILIFLPDLLDIVLRVGILISILLLIILFRSNNKITNILLLFLGLINVITIVYVFGWVREIQFGNLLLIIPGILLFVVPGIFIFQQKLWAYVCLLILAIFGLISMFLIPANAPDFMVVPGVANILSLYLPFQKIRGKNFGKLLASPAQDRAWDEMNKGRPFSRS